MCLFFRVVDSEPHLTAPMFGDFRGQRRLSYRDCAFANPFIGLDLYPIVRIGLLALVGDVSNR